MEVENTDKTILRRLEIIQAFADRQRPAVVAVTFIDGSSTTTDPGGAIDIFRERGAGGEIARIEADRPEYAAAAGIMTVLCNPAPDRRIEDFV